MTNTNFVRNNAKWRALIPARPLPQVDLEREGARKWQPGEVWVACGPDNANAAVFRVLRLKPDAAVGSDVYDVEVLASAGPWSARSIRFQRFSLGSYFGEHSALVQEAGAPKVAGTYFSKFQLEVAPTKRDVARAQKLLADPRSNVRTQCCPVALALGRSLRARFRRWKDVKVVVGLTHARVEAGRVEFRTDLPVATREFILGFDHGTLRTPPAPTDLTFTRTDR